MYYYGVVLSTQATHTNNEKQICVNTDYATIHFTYNTTKTNSSEGRRKQIIYEDITYPQWRHLVYRLVTVTGGEYSKWKEVFNGISKKLENVAIANALQLQVVRRRTIPIRFNFIARVKFQLPLPIRCRLTQFLLLIRYVMLWPWTLTPWHWPLTLNMCSRPASPLSNAVRHLNEIGQSVAELLRFEYLTLWPWTCITCITCIAMLWDSLHKV